MNNYVRFNYIMPGRQQIPSFQIASGTANERDNSYNIPTGSIFFNTDTSNIELSGNVVVAGDISGVNKITFSNGQAIPAPYYFAAHLASDQTVNESTTTKVNLEPSLPSPYDINDNDWNASNKWWVCPKTGLYQISLTVFFSNYPTQGLRQTKLYLYKKPDSGTDTVIQFQTFFTGYGADDGSIYQGPLHLVGLHSLDEDDCIYAKGRAVHSGSGTVKFVGHSSHKYTELIIARVL